MKFIEVKIVEYLDNGFPSFVRCEFVDVFGKLWNFYEKGPVVSFENITKDTILPKKGYIAGKILNEENGVVYFSTEEPYHIEVDDDINKFYVSKSQIIEKRLDE